MPQLTVTPLTVVVDIDTVLSTVVLVSLFSVTLGNIILRVLMRASYEFLAVCWCMSVVLGVVFGVLLQKAGMDLPLLVMAITLVPLCFFWGWRNMLVEIQAPKLAARIYGGGLMTAGIVLTLNAWSFQQPLVPLWGRETTLIGFLAVSALLSFNGMWAVLRSGSGKGR